MYEMKFNSVLKVFKAYDYLFDQLVAFESFDWLDIKALLTHRG